MHKVMQMIIKYSLLVGAGLFALSYLVLYLEHTNLVGRIALFLLVSGVSLIWIGVLGRAFNFIYALKTPSDKDNRKAQLRTLRFYKMYEGKEFTWISAMANKDVRNAFILIGVVVIVCFTLWILSHGKATFIAFLAGFSTAMLLYLNIAYKKLEVLWPVFRKVLDWPKLSEEINRLENEEKKVK